MASSDAVIDDEVGGPRWVHADPWVIVGGALLFLFVLGWIIDPPGAGGPRVIKQLGLMALFVGTAVVTGGVLAGFAGRGILAELARWMVVVVTGLWVLGIGAALTFATGDMSCVERGSSECTTTALARLTGAVPIAALWFGGRELAHRLERSRNRLS